MQKSLLLAVLLIPVPTSSRFGVRHGTIVVMSFTKERIVIAADSRESSNDGREHWDDKCKILALGDKLFFSSTGRTSLTVNDRQLRLAEDVARKVYADFQRQQNDSERLRLVSWYWGAQMKNLYQDIALQRPRELMGNLEGKTLAQGLFGASIDDGSLAAYVVKIHYETVPSNPAPLISFDAIPIEDTPARAFGSPRAAEGVREFLQNETLRAKAANTRFRNSLHATEIANIEPLRIRVAVETAIEWKLDEGVGGAADALVLPRGGTISWVEPRKACSDVR